MAETAQPATDGARDFDFWMGSWTVRNRRLRERLRGSTEWEEFEADCDASPLLGGLGNADEFRTGFWPGFIGMTLRFFNPATKQWAIYWVDSRRGVLEPPVFGGFDGGIGLDKTGLFFGDDTFEGRPIRVRFTWRHEGTRKASWEQAFSTDGGETWETNWTMDMTRTGG